MHMTIGAIVYAPDSEEAISKAGSVFDSLTENQYPFDYWTYVDKDGEEKEEAYEATSKIGAKEIQNRMKWTKDDFMESLKEVRRIIESHTDEMIWNEEENPFEPGRNDFFRHLAYEVGQYKGNRIWLYDDDGEGIRTERQLHNVLTKYKCIFEDRGEPNPCKKDKVWIVIADVHF